MAPPDLRSSAEAAQAVEAAAALFRQGRLGEAEKICTRVLKAQPNYFDALHLAGLLKFESGKAGAALGLLEAALKINPRSAQVLSNLGLTLAALARDADALGMFDQAVAIAPDNVEAHNNRGNVLLKLRRPQDALAAFEQAVTRAPRFLPARLNRGTALAQLNRFEEAIVEYDAVLAAQPVHPETHLNRGMALFSLGRNEEAIKAYNRALAARPDYVKALISRGMTLQALNRFEEALADYGRVTELDKDNADARHNAALARLTVGDYRRGFEDYEWRWERTGMARRRFGKPLWLGEFPLTRKTILLHAEQGLGDTIHFVRYAPLLARTGAKIVLEAPVELIDLLARVDGVSVVVARGAALPAFDVHCPLGSLPRALRTEPSTIPAEGPYLKASAKRIAKWQERIGHLPVPRVAIAWSGRAAFANDRNRSIPLARLSALLDFDRVSFISIQRDLRDGDAEALTGLPHVTAVGEALDDFDDTAAVVTLADLVISVDTSVVHLAGALRRPTWILLAFNADWRWMLGRDDSPWYPTARLFRQSSPGDWDSVIGRVKDELLTLRRDEPP